MEETTLSVSHTKSMRSLSAEMSSNFSFSISSEMLSITPPVMKQPLPAQLTPRGDDGKKKKKKRMMCSEERVWKEPENKKKLEQGTKGLTKQ